MAELDDHHPELNLAVDFHVANNLHTNFYEDWLDPKMVEKGVGTVKSFVKKMEKFL